MELEGYFMENVNGNDSNGSNKKEKRAMDDTLPLASLDWKERLRLALKLSSPLYALFVQFQNYVDASKTRARSKCRYMFVIVIFVLVI